ncbi:MAG TPA: potassium channel protein [Kosmotogaceae bacterium]|nr:MAG: K+ transport system, NAD-binding component [Thermotogales bacterium 46_20]HAA85859.1 potassium channel protein [Kosmotogaceae bacterium]
MQKDVGTRGIVRSLLLLGAVFLVGTIGYVLIEGWGLLDSFYMIVITISTVGYGTPTELSETGKVFTSIIILSGVSSGIYAISNITAFLVEGRVNEVVRRRRLLKDIERVSGHYIIVGAGDVGETVAREISRAGRKVVIVEKDEARLSALREQAEDNELFLQGDATDESTLLSAGLKRAVGLVTTLPEDADNVFVVLTARRVSSEVTIISKANDRNNSSKLQYAGADKVVPITDIGARRIVSMLFHPSIIGFLDSIMKAEHGEIVFEQLKVPDNIPSEGIALDQMQIPKKVGLIVIAVNDGSTSKFNPSASTIVKPGHELVVLGSADKIKKLRELLERGEII